MLILCICPHFVGASVQMFKCWPARQVSRCTTDNECLSAIKTKLSYNEYFVQSHQYRYYLLELNTAYLNIQTPHIETLC